jgi:hypothetical protein
LNPSGDRRRRPSEAATARSSIESSAPGRGSASAGVVRAGSVRARRWRQGTSDAGGSPRGHQREGVEGHEQAQGRPDQLASDRDVRGGIGPANDRAVGCRPTRSRPSRWRAPALSRSRAQRLLTTRTCPRDPASTRASSVRRTPTRRHKRSPDPCRGRRRRTASSEPVDKPRPDGSDARHPGPSRDPRSGSRGAGSRSPSTCARGHTRLGEWSKPRTHYALVAGKSAV